MMVIVCSDEALLVKRCTDLFGVKHDIRQLLDRQKLRYHVSGQDDLLVIDLEKFREQDIPVVQSPAVALTVLPVYEQAMRLLQKGVRGYGNRHMHRDNLLQAAASVQAGQVWLPPEIITRMITSMPGTSSPKKGDTWVEPLSKREEEVAKLVTHGLSNKEIAEKTHISVRTVKAHLTSIFAKTGYRDRLELAVNMKDL